MTVNPNPTSTEIHQVALAAHEAGFSVVPPREDGTKAPQGDWKQYQAQRPDRAQIESWYGPCTGVGLVCGKVSGNLELFEFDDPEVYQAFKAMASKSGLGDLVEMLEARYQESTPGNGVHWFYRCAEISGNTKLARRPKRPEEMEHPKDKIKTLIETKGEGGYAIIAPSGGRVHPSENAYKLEQGSLDKIITISPEQRESLWELARCFDQTDKTKVSETRSQSHSNAYQNRPGDDFNERANWASILPPHGWEFVFQRGSVDHWRRPGKSQGVSATTNYQDSGLLYVFSSSTEFDVERGYSKFGAYALLNHGGDHSEAAKDLAAKGFGGGPPFSANGHSSPGALGAALPVIQANYRQVRDISDDCIEALVSANDPAELFVRGGEIARVRADEKDRPIIDNFNEAMLTGRLTRTADFIQVSAKGKQYASPPPQTVVRDILAMGIWPFPSLEGVVEVPTLRPDGSILIRPGYDPATRLFYLPDPTLAMMSIPEYPTHDDMQLAVGVIEDILWDFPFVDQASRANAWAVLVTTLIRHAIKGRCPLCLCDAPKSGTGKGLLASIISIIVTGRQASMFSAPDNDEEWRKQITSALLTGTTMIIIDNVEGRLEAPSLSRVLTSPIWADRKLKTNEMAFLPNNATWLATGNNIALAKDMPRRCYLVRMDARHAQPWERTGFRHPRLEEFATEHRSELVAALLTIVRGWYAAGQPSVPVPTFGGFEAWSENVGSILAFAGITGFLTNLPALHLQLDQDTPAWEAFFDSWYAVINTAPVMVNTLTEYLKANQDFQDVLPEYLKGELAELVANRKSNFKQKLGGALRARKDTVYPNNLQLVRDTDDPHKKVARWVVAPVGFAGTYGDPQDDSESAAGTCGEQIPLPPRMKNPNDLSTDSEDATPRKSPQPCLDNGKNGDNSPRRSAGSCVCPDTNGSMAIFNGPECSTCSQSVWCPNCGGCRSCANAVGP